MSGGPVAIHQVRRPDGWPTHADFAFVPDEVGDPVPGTALVENLYLSVDPYMRQEMDGGWVLNAPLEGRAIGRVVASADPALRVGDVVLHGRAWRTHALVEPAGVRVLPDLPGVPLTAYLGVLGGTGLTAYVALTRIARLTGGEAVFVSSAAGAVGSAAGQIARLLGVGRLIGSAGTPAKVRHLTEDLGYDAAFDYHDGRVTELLAQAAPEGIDVYLDNVGGDHLEAAIAALRENGRIAACGMVSTYNATEPVPAPGNLIDIVEKSLRMEGFLVSRYMHLRQEFLDFLVPHVQAGRIVPDQTVVGGFDNTVDAFIGMLRGGNTGKMIVAVADA